MKEKVKSFFKFEERNASFRKEIIGGIVTFLAMSYILVVNPLIVSGTLSGRPDLGVPYGAVFFATALGACIGTLLMGLFANLPIGLAPGMGINAFFINVVIIQMGYTWQEALAVSLISGILFLIISLTPIRKMLIKAIPPSLKSAIGAGIGFFIASVGLKNGGIIVIENNQFGLGDFTNPEVLLAFFSILIIIVIFSLKNKVSRFSFIISIVASAILGLILNYGFNIKGQNIPSLGEFNYDALKDVKDVAFTGVINGFQTLFKGNILQVFFVIFALLFVDVFDTAGTLIAVSKAANLTDENGEIPNMEKAFLADALGTIAGASLGTPVVTSFVESATGVESGAKTGFSNIIVALLFLLSIALFPIFQVFSSSAVTAGALTLVGVLMAMQLSDIDWSDPTSAITSFLTIIIMVLTGSIANGIAFGFIFYSIIKIIRKEYKDVHPIVYGTSLIFVLYFIMISSF